MSECFHSLTAEILFVVFNIYHYRCVKAKRVRRRLFDHDRSRVSIKGNQGFLMIEVFSTCLRYSYILWFEVPVTRCLLQGGLNRLYETSVGTELASWTLTANYDTEVNIMCTGLLVTALIVMAKSYIVCIIFLLHHFEK